MKCAICHAENPTVAKFCIECGNPMEFRCPACGALTPSEGRFCMECGIELKNAQDGTAERELRPSSVPRSNSEDDESQTKTGVSGERKYVTVLFSDMSGYTAMSEKLDPEDVKRITTRVFGRISQIVASYEGFIEKFVGDAIMAVFGARKAYEDDPIRAKEPCFLCQKCWIPS